MSARGSNRTVGTECPPYGLWPYPAPTMFRSPQCGDYFATTSFGAGFGPDFDQNFHHGASPLAFGLMKWLSG